MLKGHRHELGRYTELARDDPKRATIISAMTLENTLHLAHQGEGFIRIATISGISMIVMGLALGGTVFAMRRLSVTQ
ncbi:MAG: hypothetical protein HYX83_02210 [Chloroflexi bacterium]|nr:hypothetical protein [Chloroflexota bacterium]